MTKSKEVAHTLEELSPFDYYKFATYVPGRTGGTGGSWQSTDYKRHPTLSAARGAISNSYWQLVRNGKSPDDCKIYEFDVESETWQEFG